MAEGSDVRLGRLAARVRALPEFRADSDWTVYACCIGGREIAGMLPPPAGMGFFDVAELADVLADVLYEATVAGRRPLWASLRITATVHELRWGVDEPIPSWMPVEPDFNLESPILWLIQWFAFDKRPPAELPTFWKEKLAEIGAWDSKQDDVAIDRFHNPQKSMRGRAQMVLERVARQALSARFVDAILVV